MRISSPRYHIKAAVCSRAFILIALICLALASSLSASELKGRFSSSLYGYENSTETHWRPYLGLNSTAVLYEADRSRNLSFESYFRWTNDFSDRLPSDPHLYLYHAYFKLTGYPTGSKIYLGRQFVYSAVGSDLIDGLRVKYRLDARIELEFYGGSRVLQDETGTVQDLSGYGLIGGRVGFKPSASYNVGVNYLMRRDLGDVGRHRVGLDGLWSFRRTDLYARTYAEMATWQLGGFLARLSSRPRGWYLSAEFDWRRPSIEANSIFSVVETDRYRGMRAEISRNLGRGCQLVAQAQFEMFDIEDSRRSLLGIRTAQYFVAWQHNEGYGGSSDGLRGYATVNLRKGLEAYWSGYFSQYKIQETQSNDLDAYSSSLGINWRAAQDLQARLEGQYTRNAVDNSDIRLFLRFTKSFAFKSEAGQ